MESPTAPKGIHPVREKKVRTCTGTAPQLPPTPLPCPVHATKPRSRLATPVIDLVSLIRITPPVISSLPPSTSLTRRAFIITPQTLPTSTTIRLESGNRRTTNSVLCRLRKVSGLAVDFLFFLRVEKKKDNCETSGFTGAPCSSDNSRQRHVVHRSRGQPHFSLFVFSPFTTSTKN